MIKLHTYGPEQWPSGKGLWSAEIYIGNQHSGAIAKHRIWAIFWTLFYFLPFTEHIASRLNDKDSVV